MTKFKSLLLLSCIAVLLFSSCSSKTEPPSDKKITVSKVNISGNGSSYIKVKEGDYTVRVVEDKIVIPIQLELVKKYQEKGIPAMQSLTLSPLDKSGIVIPDLGLDFLPATMGDWGKINELLAGEVGKQATISFEWNYFSDVKKQVRIIKEIEGFELTRADITNKSTNTEENTGSAISSTTISDEGSENWDNLLDDYDKYVTDYIKFFKKAQAGDETAMAEYPAMLESSTKLQESLVAAQNDNKLSSSQMSRMSKIQARLVTVMSEAQPEN